MPRPFAFLLALAFALPAAAGTEIRFWHAMSGPLAGELEALVARFNGTQREVRVVAEWKGDYERTMELALTAWRDAGAPHLVQVFEVGTGSMLAARAVWRPVWQVLAEAGERTDNMPVLPAVAGFYSDASGRLVALPFNTSTPVMFYNRDAFRRAKLDPAKPPRTWYEMPAVLGELREAGVECPFTTSWPVWVHLENMSAWHNQEFATRGNGMGGADARLAFNTRLMVRHISMLTSWQRSLYFHPAGRAGEAEARFANGECAVITASSAALVRFQREAGFDFAVAPLPHYDDWPGAPQNTLIGGAALWVMAGRRPEEYRAVGRFLGWLKRPEVQAEWARRTGYVPITRAALELLRRDGHYERNPGQDTAMRQLALRSPTADSRGIRLGNYVQIRAIIEDELEQIWAGKAPKAGLDAAVARGNEVLRRFEQTVGAVPPAAPRRP